MADSENIKDTSARLLASATVAAGVGTALYKGFKESPGAFQRTVEAVRGGSALDTPRMMTARPIDDQSRLLSEAFSAADDMMGSGGKTELLRRTYERALYGAGIIADEDRGRIVSELVDSSKSWEMAEGAIRKYEHQLGGNEGLYGAMREITGGTIRGNRRKEVSQLVRETSDSGYIRSSFEPTGKFWAEKFNLQVDQTDFEIKTRSLSQKDTSFMENRFREATGHQVSTGIRLSNRNRSFISQQEGLFEFAAQGGKLTLPFNELKIGGPKSKWFLQVPSAVEHRGVNFVAADNKGMSFASVPHFAVPQAGGGYKKVTWNEGLNTMLYGDKSNKIEGLAQKLQKLHGDEKAMRDLTQNWNTQISGLFNRVTNSQGKMTQARMHSESILPTDRFLAKITGEEIDNSVEGLTDFFSQMKKAGPKQGFNVGALASADPMGDQFRVSTQDWGQRWDVFGKDYAIERKFGSRIKPFNMTDKSMAAMADAPIGGILPRGHGITSTAAARAEMEALPQAVAYLSLQKARHFSKEESVISKRLTDMMTMQSTQRHEVLAGTSQAGKGQVLKEGTSVGVDYRTGKSIYARGSNGLVEQKIVDARQIGNIVKLDVQTELPLQNQMKIFGYKSQVHIARGGISQELRNEWGAGKAALAFQKDIEFIGHADLMKKIPQEVNKQMAEASWMVMQKRLSEAGVLQSGGKSKLGRQAIRSARGQKTYTWAGGLPKNYINMDMFMYVKDQQYRDKALKNRQKGGVRIAKKLGLKGEQEALGTGLELLRYAKKHGLNQDEMSLIGGAFYQQLEKAAGDTNETAKLLKGVGLTTGDIDALRESKGVLAMPTMHVGGYASFDHKWGRAGMDYRALNELKAQQWGEAGNLLVGEIARRVIPAQDLIETERSMMTFAGRTSELPEGIERISRIREAQNAIGQKEFIFDYGGKEVYVPGAKAQGMGQFPTDQGEVRSQELRASYERYFKAQGIMRDTPGEISEAGVAGAYDDLQKKVFKGWSASASLRGKVVGTAGPVARMRVPTDTSGTLAREFGGVGVSKEEALKQFVQAKDQVFTVGITKETGGKMFRDLLSKSTPEERAFLEAQERAFLSGEKVTGFAWRHPTHRPQSLMPAWFEMVKGQGESAQFHALTMKHGDRVLDISLAQGMKLDYDFDHVQLGLIADEKVKAAQDTLLNSRRYREQFIEGASIQADIMKRVKDAAASGAATKNVEGYVSGLQKLVGVKMETGTISTLVGEMRAAAAFQAGGREFTMASYLLAELEEGPISSKHGLNVGEVSDHLRDFVKNEGSDVRGAMSDAWQKLFQEGEFSAGEIKYSRDEFVNKMQGWISASEESGDLAAFRNIARRGAQAQKGKEWAGLTTDMLANALKQFQGGRGDLNAVLTREMRMGPGSAISQSRVVANGLKDMASTAGRAFKKHWRYPAAAAVVAGGLSLALSGNELSMPDHSDAATQLGQGPGIPHISAPTMNPNRIITAGGGGMPVGYGMHSTGDYTAQGIRQIGSYGVDTGASVRIRDDRGAITPEYIEKARRERYY